eukprot:SAG11_NODE_1048_length_6038_cov_8.260818_3_plen_103_part_00
MRTGAARRRVFPDSAIGDARVLSDGSHAAVQTGSGKTLAFMLPVLYHLLKAGPPPPQVLANISLFVLALLTCWVNPTQCGRWVELTAAHLCRTALRRRAARM